MHLVAVATDYDETAAENGRVGEDTIAAPERVAGSGRKVILVTGRELPASQSRERVLDLIEERHTAPPKS